MKSDRRGILGGGRCPASGTGFRRGWRRGWRGRVPSAWVAAWLILAGWAAGVGSAADPARFRVMTYNVENYLLAPTESRKAKSPESRAKVAESIVAGRPDILALQEIGDLAALRELQGRLRERGLDLTHSELVRGWDTNIVVALLSRFPITRRAPHTNESFLLNGRRWHMSRGVGEVDVAVTAGYDVTVFVAHLKSRRALATASEADVREQEAEVLRGLVEARLQARPTANVVVCGDFNDTRDTPALRTLVGRRAPRLHDVRPVERNGDQAAAENPRYEPRRVAWTHYYGREDTYSRIDYLLVSPGLRREWQPGPSEVVAVPDWGVASDHRPVVAEFLATDQ